MWFFLLQLYFPFNPARLCICPACINVSRCAWAHLFPLLLLSQPVRWSSAATHQQRERNKEAETDQLPFETLNQFPSHRHQSPASSWVYRYEIFRLSLQLPRSSNIHPLKVTAETTELRNKDLILRGWHFFATTLCLYYYFNQVCWWKFDFKRHKSVLDYTFLCFFS